MVDDPDEKRLDKREERSGSGGRDKNLAEKAAEHNDPNHYSDEDWAGAHPVPEYCYITTACVKAMNLPDDCLELKALRGLRDNYVLKLTEGKSLWRDYKATAPGIIMAIESRREPKKIYEMIFTNYIQPIAQLALDGKNKDALLQYKEMTDWLKKEFLDETRAKRKKVLEEVVAEKKDLLDYATRDRIAHRMI